MGCEQEQSRGFCDNEEEDDDDEELITRPKISRILSAAASSSNNFRASPNFSENNYWVVKSFGLQSSPHQRPEKSHDRTNSPQESKSMAVVSIEREHMFEKVVTPSDVGKLNRLVIPKQYAEKFFPLDSSSNEKGLLLNFEDRNGKPWRFRYSYWNSSQSYVMTKGWSRFVKEKQLDAGDIVSFQRGIGELGKDKLFIDWRRRPEAPQPTAAFLQFPSPSIRWRVPIIEKWNFNTHHPYYSGSDWPYHLRSSSSSSPLGQIGGSHLQNGILRNGVADYSVVIDSVPVVRGKSAAKRLRLFGVNMECPINEETERDILSSTAVYPHHHPPSCSFPHLQLNEIPKPEIQVGLLEKGKSSLSLDLEL